ncbi:MAG TPA: hypothetical protein VGP93_01915, partial [Polyangiaceae bacterium]|nr:hypothetical protein [Polyangiaceae bacterium]
MRSSAYGSFVLCLGLGVLGCSSSSHSPDDASAGGGGGTAGANGGGAKSTGGAAGSGGASAGGTSQGTAGSGGSAGSGGNAGANGGTTGAGGNAGAPQHTVGDCGDLGDVGTWDDITPPGVSLDPNFVTPASTNYGMGSFVLDPQTSGTVYVGTSAQGIYKTTNCGADWVHINTGRNGTTLDSGRQWTMQIDPVDPQVIYTNTGYGMSGVWKSTDGGVDWDQILPDDVASDFIYNGFVARISMDPTNHLHLLVTPHFTCQNG